MISGQAFIKTCLVTAGTDPDAGFAIGALGPVFAGVVGIGHGRGHCGSLGARATPRNGVLRGRQHEMGRQRSG